MENRPLKIYFAGDLFDCKDLGGNLLLAESIERCSNNRYKVMLPQNGECEVKQRTAQNIRNADFQLLFSCDLVVANFDGHDLDSGTVTEFCFAKMVDMPTVLLRTDFRHSGDHDVPDGVPWNLMCSHFPRTEVLYINSMQLYHSCGLGNAAALDKLSKFYQAVAQQTVAALDKAAAARSWLHKEELFRQYSMAVKAIGGELDLIFDEDLLQKTAAAKAASGLYG